MTEHAVATGLSLEFGIDLVHRPFDGLSVGDLRASDVGLDAELTLHSIDDDL